MAKHLPAKKLLSLDPTSPEAQAMEATVENSIVVEKSIFRMSNQAFFLGLFFVLTGLFSLFQFPQAKIAEGFGGISVHGLFLTSGIVLMSWFKTGEILKAVGEFISKIRGGAG